MSQTTDTTPKPLSTLLKPQVERMQKASESITTPVNQYNPTLLTAIFSAIKYKCRKSNFGQRDYEIWGSALQGAGCVDEQIMGKAMNRLEVWKYQTPPDVTEFIRWYRDAAMAAANVGTLEELKDEIFSCTMQQITVDQLTPAAYWIWSKANRITMLRMATPEQIEKQVHRYYDKLKTELVSNGTGILKPPPPLLSNREEVQSPREIMRIKPQPPRGVEKSGVKAMMLAAMKGNNETKGEE